MVIAIDPAWDQSWLETHFTHEAMDAEASRQIAYLSLHHQPTPDNSSIAPRYHPQAGMPFQSLK